MTCSRKEKCKFQGAKLLNEGIITEVKVIKFKHLNWQIAQADGFEDTAPEHGETALWNLQYFLTVNYGGGANTEFMVIRWKVNE